MYSWKGTVAYTGRFVFEGFVRPTDWRPLILPGDWWTSSRERAKLECYVYQEDEEHLVEDKLRESEIKTAWKYTQISHGKKSSSFISWSRTYVFFWMKKCLSILISFLYDWFSDLNFDFCVSGQIEFGLYRTGFCRTSLFKVYGNYTAV